MLLIKNTVKSSVSLLFKRSLRNLTRSPRKRSTWILTRSPRLPPRHVVRLVLTRVVATVNSRDVVVSLLGQVTDVVAEGAGVHPPRYLAENAPVLEDQH